MNARIMLNSLCEHWPCKAHSSSGIYCLLMRFTFFLSQRMLHAIYGHIEHMSVFNLIETEYDTVI